MTQVELKTQVFIYKPAIDRNRAGVLARPCAFVSHLPLRLGLLPRKLSLPGAIPRRDFRAPGLILHGQAVIPAVPIAIPAPAPAPVASVVVVVPVVVPPIASPAVAIPAA